VDKRFLDLIETNHPVALVILAHYAVLMAQGHRAWWLKDWPERILNTSITLLDPIPDFRKWFDWPLEQIRGVA
jgi:hypothetical protein